MFYDFVAGFPPFGYAYNFDNYLFNKARHLNTQGIEQREDYFLVHEFKKRIEAKIHFLVDGGKAYSPYRSLFGSFEMNPHMGINLLSKFTAFIQEDLVGKGVNEIFITHQAAGYHPVRAHKVHEALIRSGFRVTKEAINHHITIGENSLEQKMHTMERRRLAKCHSLQLEFLQPSFEHFDRVYDYIETCRAQKGLSPSVSREKMREYLRLFPQDYFMFTVEKAGEIFAATIAIKVSRKIMYNFLPASLERYSTLSPMVMLVDRLYEFCRERNYEILDLGISTLPEGEHQDSLIAFKEHIGGEKSKKMSYAWKKE
jgi:hypothetical protein